MAGCAALHPPYDAIAMLEREILEIARRRADHGVALRPEFEHREAALHQPLRREAEQPVDPGEAAGFRIASCENGSGPPLFASTAASAAASNASEASRGGG